jgi:hypothetical protein
MKRNRDAVRLFCICSVIAGLFLFQACGDDPASPEAGDPPEIPLLQGVDMNDSYFQENHPSDEDMQEDPTPFEPYLTAQGIAVSTSMVLEESLQLPQLFLLVTSQREPVFQDGVWVWDFPFTVDGELIDEEEDFDVDVFVTANVNENANWVVWEFRFSGSDTPFGDVENFTIFSAETSLDNSSGELQFFSPENPDVPILDVEWDIAGVTEKDISLTIIASGDEEPNGETNGEPVILIIDYTEEENEFSLTFNDGSDEAPYVIEWNTQTLEGSITSDGVTCFWGEDLAMTECG